MSEGLGLQLFFALRLIAALGWADVPVTQPYAATPDTADASFANQLDAHVLERLHNLGQRINVAAYESVARFHALNGGQGQSRAPCERRLVNAEQSAGGTKLRGSYHVLNITIHVPPLIKHAARISLERHVVSFGKGMDS